MPCSAHLLRLRDSRHALHDIPRHAVTYSSRQIRHRFDNARLVAREREAVRQRARLDALARLDEHIKPDDLSATLEAHRDANRASVIRRVNTATDPEVARPSFLENRPPLVRRTTEARNIEPLEDKPARTQFNKIVTDISSTADDATSFQLRSLNRAAEFAKANKNAPSIMSRSRAQYLRWLDFLREHEEPLGELPKFSTTTDDRPTFFAVLRRVHALLRPDVVAAEAKPASDRIPKDFTDYTGFPRGIISGLKGSGRQEPWARRPKHNGIKYTMTEWLDAELLNFAQWMETTPAENAARAKLSETLLDLIKQVDPALQVETFGSQATGLSMPNSDIDIRIVDPAVDNHPYQGDSEDKEAKRAWAIETSRLRKSIMIFHLRDIQSALAKHKDFEKIESNESAFVPLIKAVHKHTGLKIQIVASKDTSASRDAIKKYLAEYSTLEPVFMVLKTTLHLRNLSDPWYGGVGSYTLFMMCVAALKHSDAQQQEKQEQEQNSNNALYHSLKQRSLSHDFLHTLNFWGNIDTTKVAVSVDPFAVFAKKVRQDWRDLIARKTDKSLFARHHLAVPHAKKPYILHLQDPAEPYNNLGRSALAIKDIQATFSKLYDDLLWEMQDPERRQDGSPLIKAFVGKSERYYDEMRIPVDLWGGQFVEEVMEEEDGLEDGIDEPRDVTEKRQQRVLEEGP
ncbi:hypothetical protein M436DRAFT_49763 [Aureobasidium namibiae CBS 147.97]|uniref:Poly(A) RNA polymerase mitochondrial-like central palm domain-containing protein n=1 Tax=Aureobasidium namibiae CBS 147.97 TaxID=1043004 RepID=A0A074WFS9_9PEZI